MFLWYFETPIYTNRLKILYLFSLDSSTKSEHEWMQSDPVKHLFPEEH